MTIETMHALWQFAATGSVIFLFGGYFLFSAMKAACEGMGDGGKSVKEEEDESRQASGGSAPQRASLAERDCVRFGYTVSNHHRYGTEESDRNGGCHHE